MRAADRSRARQFAKAFGPIEWVEADVLTNLFDPDLVVLVPSGEGMCALSSKVRPPLDRHTNYGRQPLADWQGF